MKRITAYVSTIALILGIYTEGSSQTYGLQVLGGTQVYIQSGTTVNVVNNLGTKIDGTGTIVINNGTVAMEGDFLSQNGSNVQSGLYKIGGSFINSSTFGATNSTVELISDNPATINTNYALYNLTINKGLTNPIVNLASSVSVNGILNFTSGYLQTNAFSMRVINTTGAITGYDATKFVITNSFTTLQQYINSGASKTYPVGTSVGNYTPLTIKQTAMDGTTLGVRVQDNVLTNGTSGSALLKGVVNKTWQVLEAGTPVSRNLDITAQWNGSDEYTLDGTKCGISRWNSTTSAWDLAWADVGAKTGADPYTRSRGGITALGTFAVGGKILATYVQLSAKVILQGAYPTSGTTGLIMSDGLRTLNLLPKIESTVASSGQSPQPNAFIHKAWGGGEDTGPFNAFANQASANNDIVDWVFVELRDPSVSSLILHTRAALLQKDGDIVNEDGTSPLKIYGVPDGFYFISIKHRNHVAVRSATTKNLSQATTTVMDFTTSLSEALVSTPPVGQSFNALATMTDGKFAMWGGNVNSDVSTRRDGPSSINDVTLITNYYGASTNPPKLNVYRREDVNMNGSVYRAGPAGINDVTRVIGYLGSKTIVTQPTF
jgi:hypothetical protein